MMRWLREHPSDAPLVGNLPEVPLLATNHRARFLGYAGIPERIAECGPGAILVWIEGVPPGSVLPDVAAHGLMLVPLMRCAQGGVYRVERAP